MAPPAPLITLTGSYVTIDGSTIVPASGSQIKIDLGGYVPGDIPKVGGTSILGSSSMVTTVASNGTWSIGPFYGNDVITPANTVYQVTFYVAGAVISKDYSLTGSGSFDIANLTPLGQSVAPASTPVNSTPAQVFSPLTGQFLTGMSSTGAFSSAGGVYTTPSANQTITVHDLILAAGQLAIQLLTNSSLTANPYSHLSGVSAIVGAGPHQGSPNTPQGWYNTMTGGTGQGVEAGTFAISIPSTYNGTAGLGFVTNALGAYVWTQDPNHYAVGLSNQTVVDATNGLGWGINPQVVAYGANGATGQTLHIIEADAVVKATGVTLYGIQVGAPSASTQNPTSSIAFDVSKPSWPSGSWTSGLVIETGATVTGHGIVLNPLATGNTQNSADIQFVATSGGGASLTAGISEDSGGNLNLNPGAGGFIRNSVAGSGIQLLSSGSNFTQLTNTATGFRSIVFPDASGNVTLVNASTSQKAETAADASLLTYTPSASAGTYRIRFDLALSAANTATLGWTATWKDSNGTAKSPTNLSLFQVGTAAPALTFTTSTTDEFYGDATIEVDNSATAIVIKLTFSGTSFAGKATATIERLV